MTRRAKGTYTTVDNRAAEYIKRHHDASASVLMTLSERYNFTRKGPMTVAEIMVETGLKERGTEKALAKLAAEGLAHKTPEGWAYQPANTGANELANEDANGFAYSGTENGDENAVLDEETQALKEVEGSRRTTNPLTPSGEGRGTGAADAGTEEGGTGLSHLDLASQDLSQAQGQGGESRSTPLTPPVPAPPPAPPATFEAACQLFHRIVNAAFVTSNRDHLQGWAEQYTPAFLELAWDIARSDKKLARVPSVGLVWLLQGTAPWPAELTAQHNADRRAKQSGPTGSDTPFVGEVRVLADGRCGRVTEVEAGDRMLTLQVGEDAADCLWVPWQATTPAVRRSA